VVQPHDFQEFIFQKGHEHSRDMPWRRDTRPYYVLVSELMLQQTQVERVIPKFEAFVAAFPDEKTLARAPLADVLTLWSGLGYNRRAKFLHDAAKEIVRLGTFPTAAPELMTLPGVGKNTAGAIMAYAYNQPSYFIETNVRTVYIHHFFADADLVDDKKIMALLQKTVPTGEGKEQPERRIHSAPGAMNGVPAKSVSRGGVGKTVGLSYGPKAFYWALMDYGSWLKRQGVVRNSRSAHYKKQSPLVGSVREVRGAIIKQLASGDMTEAKLRRTVVADDRFEPALSGLVRDGLVMRTGELLHLTK
jgi:A/G-specific adenine glycosylase